MPFDIKLTSSNSGFNISLGGGENLGQKMLVTQGAYVANRGHEVHSIIEGEGLVFYGYGGLDDGVVASLIAVNNVLNQRNANISPQRQNALRKLVGLN